MKAAERSSTQSPMKTCTCSTPRAFKRLLVAIDDSEQSALALQTAARLAAQLRAEVVLLHVYWVEPLMSPEIGLIPPDPRVACVDRASVLLNCAKAKLPESIHVETVLREGDPATEILRAATVFDADLILMGTHARGHIAQAVLGSVAHAVTRKSSCPVLTVSHAAVEDTALPDEAVT